MLSVTRDPSGDFAVVPDGGLYVTDAGVYHVPEATWERYQFLRAELSSVEQAIIECHVDPAEEPEEVKALKAAGLSDDEVAVILSRRLAAAAEEPAEIQAVDAVVVPIDKSLSPGQMSAFPEDFPSAAPCPKHRRGVHVPARYMLMEDGTVDAVCSCGHVLKNVPCPHRNQKLRRSVVVCEWCDEPLIRNASVIEPKGPVEEGEQPGARMVDTNRYRAHQ